MSLNACELEIDLFCHGMRVPEDVSLDGVRGLARTRAGLGSGLDLAIESDSRLKPEVWVNVPVVESFAQTSPYRLAGDVDAGFRIVDDRTSTEYAVRLPQEPAWYARSTSRGVPMHRIGVLQGTYLAIYVNPVCAFWNATPRLNCKFCTTGRNVGPSESIEKTVDDVVETCRAAREESGVTFVHLNGGFDGEHAIEHVLPYVKAIKERVGLLVGVQLAPERDFSRYDALVHAGADHVSFCIELLDPRWFQRMCPGKAKVHGQQLYFDAMAYCVALLPYGAVSGEIIAGLEPIEQTLAAIDRITAIGAFPTVCIFRPTVGSDLENWPVPSYAEMRSVMEHMYAACRRALLPIGVAPNIEVSLVVNPDDAAMLAEPTIGFYGYEAYRRMLRLASRRSFRRRMNAN
ncbi:MAG TPA: radical SAM protein [Vicinamibacterales bacterium]|nr:radical SAM protein [Vicinamibacterales bacterium]